MLLHTELKRASRVMTTEDTVTEETAQIDTNDYKRFSLFGNAEHWHENVAFKKK